MNIVLCCDGTANEFAEDRTNVVKLFSVLDHRQQKAYYHPGLGTMEPPGALTTVTRAATRLLGKAIGYGLEADVRDAYVFIMRHYQPGDALYMFGFSRGAYTVRAVAALLHRYGLLRPGNEPLVPYAIRLLVSSNPDKGFARAEELAASFKADMGCVTCEPAFVGVWDTVSSVGWIENPLKLPYVSDNPSIHVGRHAISIDERRAFFRNHLWRSSPHLTTHGPRDVKQVWFPGVHCDVGGGYPEKESGLAKLALEWMMCEAMQAGLILDVPRAVQVLGYAGSPLTPSNPRAARHESLTGAWYLAELLWKRHYNWARKRWGRRMNLGRRRTIPKDALVHESAYQRGAAYKKLLPPTATIELTCDFFRRAALTGSEGGE